MAIPIIDYQMGGVDYRPLTQSLANLGQGVGMALAMKAQQKQAAEALPALQESYKNAFGKISRGEIADGYSDLLSASMNPAVAQNPFLSQYATQADQLARSAANAVIQQGFQRGGGGGGGGGGTALPSQGIPAVSAEEAARGALLGQGSTQPMVQPGESLEGEMPLDFTQDTDVTAVAQRTEPSSEQLTEYLTGVASSAGTREFKEGIRASLKNIPSAETMDDIRKYVSTYKSLTQDQQKNEREKITQFFESPIDINDTFTKGSGYTEVDGAENIFGKGYKGFVLKESVEPEKTTISSRGQSVTYGTSKSEIEATAKNIIGSVKELNRGDIGKFFKDNGGISNIELVETERDGRVLRNKQNPDIFISIEDMKNADAIATSFGALDSTFPNMSRLSDRGATASLVAIRTPTAEGPSRSAATARATQPTNLLDMFPPQR